MSGYWDEYRVGGGTRAAGPRDVRKARAGVVSRDTPRRYSVASLSRVVSSSESLTVPGRVPVPRW